MPDLDPGRRPDVWTAATLYADDLSPGDAFDLGTHTVSAAELTQFAGQWDPQFFHLDAAAADRGMLVVEEIRHRDEQRSLVTMRGSLRDTSGEPVLTMTVDAYVARRPATT